VKCINPFLEAVNLPSGSTLGRFYSVQEENSGPSWGAMTGSFRQRPTQGRRTAPPHTPYNSGTRGGYRHGCVSNGERRSLAKLLHRYNDAPHHGDNDDSLNRAVRQEVPLVAGTAPTRQPTRRLGPRKKGGGSPRSKLETRDHPENEYY